MSRLTRDRTAEPVSRDQIIRHARGQGNIIFPVQLTTCRIGSLTRLIHTLLYVMTIHTYIHTVYEFCACDILFSLKMRVCVCVFFLPITQEEGHTGFLIHLPSAVIALIFLARRIQPFLSLVDREVGFCVPTN